MLGQLISIPTLKSIGMSKNKVTFEQRRQKELDDILHVLQATVQGMEEDCSDRQYNTWRACSQSTNLMDPHSHCFSITSGNCGNCCRVCDNPLILAIYINDFLAVCRLESGMALLFVMTGICTMC